MTSSILLTKIKKSISAAIFMSVSCASSSAFSQTLSPGSNAQVYSYTLDAIETISNSTARIYSVKIDLKQNRTTSFGNLLIKPLLREETPKVAEFIPSCNVKKNELFEITAILSDKFQYFIASLQSSKVKNEVHETTLKTITLASPSPVQFIENSSLTSS